jgi:hypothetical protein
VTQQSPAPGWYPDPSDPRKNIYWNGTAWSGPPPQTEADNSSISKKTAVAVGVSVLVAIGLVMSMQSVSLLSGSGPIWTGVGVVAAGTAVAFFMRATKAVCIVAALCLAFSLFNAFYMEKQLSDKRNEITQIFQH